MEKQPSRATLKRENTDISRAITLPLLASIPIGQHINASQQLISSLDICRRHFHHVVCNSFIVRRLTVAIATPVLVVMGLAELDLQCLLSTTMGEFL